MKPSVLFATGNRQVGLKLQPEVADVCQVKVSVSSGQAYADLRREPYQVFIVESKLPQLDSVELAHALWHSPSPQGIFVSWGTLDNVVYVSEMKNWEQMTVRRSFDQLVGTLRALLDPTASRILEAVRYQPKENTFFVAFRNGKTYEFPRNAIEADDASPILGQPRIIHGGHAFEVRQASGNRYQVPWDLVLYHQEPSYPYHKGKTGQRETEAHRAERIGGRVRQEREGRGWSLAELARRTGIQPPNLSRLENGKHVPSLDTLQRVADALGVRVAELVAA
jgi:DNA-binding Xre family transcriptional regulator